MLGYVGQLTADALRQFDLRGPATVAEVKLSALDRSGRSGAAVRPAIALSGREPRFEPGGRRGGAVGRRCGHGAHERRPLFESLEYRDTYRDPERLGQGKKSLLFSIALRSAEGTLTSEQADEVRDRIVAACRAKHGAELRVGD